MVAFKGSDGTEYLHKPPSGGIATREKSKVEAWIDDDGKEWEPVRVGTGRGKMMWRKKQGK